MLKIFNLKNKLNFNFKFKNCTNHIGWNKSTKK